VFFFYLNDDTYELTAGLNNAITAINHRAKFKVGSFGANTTRVIDISDFTLDSMGNTSFFILQTYNTCGVYSVRLEDWNEHIFIFTIYKTGTNYPQLTINNATSLLITNNHNAGGNYICIYR